MTLQDTLAESIFVVEEIIRSYSILFVVEEIVNAYLVSLLEQHQWDIGCSEVVNRP